MALTEKDHAEIRRLTVLKLALDSPFEGGTTTSTEKYIARAKEFEDFIKGEAEPDEKSRQP